MESLITPLNGDVFGLSVLNENTTLDLDLLNTIPNIRWPFSLQFYARFDDVTKYWQLVFDLGMVRNSDNVYAGEFADTTDFHFGIVCDGDVKQIFAPNSIEINNMTFWRVGVDANRSTWIEKNPIRIADIQGNVPRYVRHTKNYIGQSNWEADNN